jgi:hypothetical protein
MLYATTVSTVKELEQILQLQQLYLRGQTSEAEEKEQGFLTVTHTFDLLQQMHQIEPSIVVKEDDVLAGYALVMPKECRNFIPILVPMFENFDRLSYQGKPINSYTFYVMGQICVAKSYRGRGVFDLLYHEHKKTLQHKYDFVLTEISTNNHRSLRAHSRVGFKTINIHTDETDEWAVTIWDWKRVP